MAFGGVMNIIVAPIVEVPGYLYKLGAIMILLSISASSLAMRLKRERLGARIFAYLFSILLLLGSGRAFILTLLSIFAGGDLISLLGVSFPFILSLLTLISLLRGDFLKTETDT